MQESQTSSAKQQVNKKPIKKSASKGSDKLVGKKRRASKQETSFSLEGSNGDDNDNQSQNQKLTYSKEHEYDSGFDDLSDDDSSTNNQLFRIEKKIQQPDLSKRERRLLQNRKSALKCRLKKQQELDKMKKQVDKLSQENRELKEKISGMNALLQCKTEENSSLNKKYADLQLQQTLIIASHLTNSGMMGGLPIGGRVGGQNQQNSLAGALGQMGNHSQLQNQGSSNNSQANNILGTLMAQSLLSTPGQQQQQQTQSALNQLTSQFTGVSNQQQNAQSPSLQSLLTDLQNSILTQQFQAQQQSLAASVGGTNPQNQSQNNNLITQSQLQQLLNQSQSNQASTSNNSILSSQQTNNMHGLNSMSLINQIGQGHSSNANNLFEQQLKVAQFLMGNQNPIQSKNCHSSTNSTLSTKSATSSGQVGSLGSSDQTQKQVLQNQQFQSQQAQTVGGPLQAQNSNQN
eukprot:403350401